MTRVQHHSDTREHLLASAQEIIQGKGFSAVGLAEILNTAGVPKGSFYHYFASKEAFGAAMLQRYFGLYDEKMQAMLEHGAGRARDCLLQYFAGWLDSSNCAQSNQVCLAVKLAAEVSDLSEPMREALTSGMNQVVTRIANCIRRGQQDGSLSRALIANETASALYSLWVGSALQFKVQRTRAPLLAAMALTQVVLAQP